MMKLRTLPMRTAVPCIRAMSTGSVTSDVDGAIAYLRLNNPDKRNAMNLGMYSMVPEAVDRINRSAAARVVILTGVGQKAFGAGSDISEFPKLRTGAEAMANYYRVESQATKALLSIRKPMIASIHGPCMGGGLNLALTADVRYAASDAKFAIPPAKLGIGYPVELMPLLVKAMGASRVKNMIFRGKVIDAKEAFRIGLVDEVVPKDELDAYVDGVAKEMSSLAPLTIEAAKMAIDEHPDAEAACLRCYESKDYAEGVKAFMEKRAPGFKGE